MHGWLCAWRRAATGRWLRLLGAFLFVIGWAAYVAIAWYRLGVGLVIFGVIVYALAILVARWIAISNRRSAESLLRLSARPDPPEEDLRAHAAKIGDLLLRTAVMVDRALGEVLFREHKIPEAHAGIFRRRTLDVANRPGLWTGFTPAEQELLRSQEGSWPWEEVWPRLLQVEDVRVLRWVLGLDQVLTPFEFLTRDMAPALEVTTEPQRVATGRCLAAYDLRPAQTMANAMVTRCVAEAVHRGVIDEPNAAARHELVTLAERMGADRGIDLLLASGTVAEADPTTLEWTAQTAIRRLVVTTALIGYLNGPSEGELHVTGTKFASTRYEADVQVT